MALPSLMFACGSLSCASSSISEVAELERLRVGFTPGRNRIVFDLSGPTPYQLSVISNPERVVVTLPDARANPTSGTKPPDWISMVALSTDRGRNPGLQYVFELGDDVTPELFTLEPSLNRGYRLVLDLHKNNKGVREENTISDRELASNQDTAEPMKASIRNAPLDNSRTPGTVAESNSSGEWSGYASFDTRLFFEDPAYPAQDRQNVSAAFEAEYYRDWGNGTQQFVFRPFYRYDANDNERTHTDIRELYWRFEYQKLAFEAGVDVVFWGVAESRHLVDIINQTDFVENIDGEEKLGQPMLKLDYMSDWGTWQLFVLPYFRERTFPGKRGRLRTNPAVDTGDPIYESSDDEYHTDFAVRWSHYIGDWDIGLAHFSGTSRDPFLISSDSEFQAKLLPFYVQIEQTSLDVQATKGAWLWKLEALYNQNTLDNYYASVAGFEYTHFGVMDTPADVGFLLEYNYDQRGERSLTALQNDIYLGIRLSANDVNDSRMLAGINVDVDNASNFLNVETVRRMSDLWTFSLEARFFAKIDKKDPLYFIKSDDYIGLELSRHF